MRAAITGAMLLPPGCPEGARFKRELALPNAAHRAWERHRRGREPERTVSCVGTQDGGPWAGGAIVPRYAPGAGGADRMVLPPSTERLIFRGELRGYQVAAVEAILGTEQDAARRTGYGGIIQAPCGAGKTAMGCHLMAALDTPALVLVHTRDLAAQWAERARGFLGVEAQVVGYGRGLDQLQPARITVASLQTLAQRGWWELHELGKRWGLVIVDEAHHAPARTMSHVISGMSGQWRVGLTATPTRADGLTPWLGWICGPTVARIAPSDLEASGAVLAPLVRMVHSPSVDMLGLEAHEREAALAADGPRNRIIAGEVRKAVAQGRRALVLVRLVSHAHALAAQLEAEGVHARPLVGELPKRARVALIEDMRSGAIEAVVATSLADEGLDAPRLDTVVLASPTGDMGRIEQRIGRVCRPHPEGQRPMVIDIVDEWGPYLGYARRRVNLYRSRGWVP